MDKSTILKLDFSLLCKRLIYIDDASIGRVTEAFERVKGIAIRYLFFFVFVAYLVIAYGYYKADYYPLMYFTFVSLLVTFCSYVIKCGKYVSPLLAAMLFVYLPITNIFVKGIFFLLNENLLINTIFLHTHFMLILFISFSGLITHQRNILYVGCISVLWVWMFTIIIDDPYLWSLALLDTVFFIGISLLMYFIYSGAYSLVIGYDKQEGVINLQNLELKDLLDFKNRMFNLFVHDIKNPINRIVAASHNELIHKDDITEPGDQILVILGNVLDVYKLEESKMELTLSFFDMDGILQNAVRHVAYLCDEKKITLNKQVSVNPIIEADAILLERVVVNLLTNAIKFSKMNSSIDIQILQKNDYLRVEVKDVGDGIPTEDIDHVFDKYYQGKNQRAEFSHSSGLGLTFCKLVVEAHGGQIGVESALGFGTTLWFELPVKATHTMLGEVSSCIIPHKYESKEFEEEVILICKKQLIGVSVYEIGKILNVLNEHAADSSENFNYWKEELINASITGNAEYYAELKKIQRSS
jgi:signal transduction histidine kinase